MSACRRTTERGYVVRWAAGLCFAGFFPAVAAAQAPAAPFTFAGLSWGISIDSAVTALVNSGRATPGIREKGDAALSGTFFGLPAVVVLRQANGRLAQVRISFDTSAAPLVLYHDIREQLIAKYGAPTRTIQRGLPPFDSVDFDPFQAMDAGRALYNSTWTRGTGTRRSMIEIWIDYTAVVRKYHRGPVANVVVSYQSAAWDAEYKRRQSNGATDF